MERDDAWDAPYTGCCPSVSRISAVRPYVVRDIRTRCILLGKGVDARGHGSEGKGKALRIPAPYVIWGFREAVVHGMAVGFSGVVIRIHDHAPASAIFGCSDSGGLWV